jgi:hypothetical protein
MLTDCGYWKVKYMVLTDGGYWKVKTNQEINVIPKGQNVIGFMKKQKFNSLGHVECMTEDNIVQKIK